MSHFRIRSILPLLFLCFACFTLPAQGQTSEDEEILSNTEGFFIEGHLQGHGLSVEDDDADDGQGLGGKVGYGFTPFFTLYVGLDGARMSVADPATARVTAEEYTLAYVEIGGRVNLRSGTNALVPYLDASLSGVGSTYDVSGNDVTFSGSGASVGAGLQYFLSPQFGLNGGLDLTFGSYSEVEANGQTESVDLGITGARLDLGFSWYL